MLQKKYESKNMLFHNFFIIKIGSSKGVKLTNQPTVPVKYPTTCDTSNRSSQIQSLTNIL